MFDDIGTKLVDFFEQEGFIIHGDMKKFDKDDKHFSEVVDKFFKPLIYSGKIITYNYDECDIYEDICGAFSCVTFAWFDGTNIDMISFSVEG